MTYADMRMHSRALVNNTAKMPIWVTSQPSKAPLYEEAFNLFCASDMELGEIAAKVGLRADALVTRATRQNWPQRRTVLRTQRTIAESADREHAATIVDARLVEMAKKTVGHLAGTLERDVEAIKALPTSPERADYPSDKEFTRARFAFITLRVELVKLASQASRELAGLGTDLAMVKGPPKEGDAGKLDLSKLTQLNITIENLHKEKPALVVPAIELTGDSEDVI